MCRAPASHMPAASGSLHGAPPTLPWREPDRRRWLAPPSAEAAASALRLTVNFLSLNESTMCLRVAGGEGCEEETAAMLQSAR